MLWTEYPKEVCFKNKEFNFEDSTKHDIIYAFLTGSAETAHWNGFILSIMYLSKPLSRLWLHSKQ